MRRSDFHFDLPAHLIAQEPLQRRSESRLLVVGSSGRPARDSTFSQLDRLCQAGDLMVFNDTRVIPARLLGRKATGGKVECLVERVLDSHTALVHLRASKPPSAGARLDFHGVEAGQT